MHNGLAGISIEDSNKN